jgi:membrane protein DedA with SNARE-associated domain
VGRWYGAKALGWVEGNMGELPAIYKWLERAVDKAGSAMVVLMPGSNIVCLLVGHRKMSLKKFVPLLMLGIAIKLAVLWRGGKMFEDQIKDFLSYIEKYQWWVVGFLFIASSLQSVRKGRPKSN